ncbi:MAG: hypothetical protein ACFFD1_04620 [Candidatus Thorarchaeota archaeon]
MAIILSTKSEQIFETSTYEYSIFDQSLKDISLFLNKVKDFHLPKELKNSPFTVRLDSLRSETISMIHPRLENN